LKHNKTIEAEAQNFVSLKRNKFGIVPSTRKITFGVGLGLFAMLIIFSVVQITAYNSLSTQGIELSKIQQQIAKIKKENTNLSEQLYIMSAYNTIASSAATLGFTEAKTSIVFVDTPQPLAIRQ